MSNFLAIDAGTGSIRAVIFSASGRIRGIASRAWDHYPVDGIPGSMDFAVERNYQLLCNVVREVLDQVGIAGTDISAVSASSMREGIVLLDSSGRELWACANVDSRSDTQVRELGADPTVEEEIYRLSGQTFALAAQPRLKWLQQHRPELYEAAATMLMLSEWVLYRLSGELCIEPTNGSTSGLLALADRDSDPRLAQLCGIRDGLLPRTLEPGDVVGNVTDSAARDTGLAPGTPVGVGGGDAQIAALGLGVNAPGQALLVGGTFWQLEVNTDTPGTHPDMAVRVNAAAAKSLWQAEAIAFHPGTAVRWFRDTFGAAEVSMASEQGRNPLDVLSEAAASVPIGSDGVIPIFSDVMNYRRWRHAAPSFLNLGLSPGPRTRAAMFRSLLENAAIVSACNLELVSAFAPATVPEIVFAGGASSSPIWTQIVADVFERPLRISAVAEATAQGTAACAASASGYYASPAEAAEDWVSWAATIDPIPGNHERYASVRDAWQTAYAAQRELAFSGVTRSMWHAPGS